MTEWAWTATSRSKRVATALLALLSLALSSGCTGHRKSRTSSGTSSAASAMPTVTALPADQSEAIQAALTSTDPATVDKALAPAVRSGFDKHTFTLLPAGSNVAIDATKLTATGNVGTVPATVTGGPAAGHWVLLLQKVNGTWLLYGTRKA